MLKGLKSVLRRAVIVGIRLLPEGSRPYRRMVYGFHWLSFVYRHRRVPGPAVNRFNDFLFMRKVNGILQQPLRRHVTDKEHGKHYIASRIGEGRTVPTLAVLRSHAGVDQFEPGSFPLVMKPTHSCGRICVLYDQHAYLKALPTLHRWLEHDYFAETLEENYASLERKIIVEPYLNSDLFLEGSMHCLHGQVRIISAIDRFDTDKRRASLDRDWQPLHVALGQPYKQLDLPRPPFLVALLASAETIAAELDYVRVDFYASDEDFLFGELTNLPGGGLARFSSSEGEKRFNTVFFTGRPRSAAHVHAPG